MPDLLSSSDWLEIRAAVKDVTDTFLKLPVVYIQRTTRKLSAFHENRSADLLQTNYNLFSLMVPENTERGRAQVDQRLSGSIDLSEGYLLFSYPDLQILSLIGADGRPVFVANKDSFLLLGKEVSIIGVNLVGPTQTNFQLVKVHYKQQMTDSKLAPVNSVAPLVTGSAIVGQTLSVSNGTWIGALSYTYQWKRDNVSIVGATNNSYLLDVADSGTQISCLVTATNTVGSIFFISNSILIP